jgi:7-cyano-7-deazaguanine synthase
MKRAIVLLSGGLDSATVLHLALKQGYKCYCLIFDYHQRHRREIKSAVRIAQRARVHYHIVKTHIPAKGSSLLDVSMKLTEVANRKNTSGIIPDTYVPARNIIFLSFALSYAESMHTDTIFIGAHIEDYSGYPDCRPEFFKAFSAAAQKGTKAGRAISIKAPLLKKNKAEIIRLGVKLGVPFRLTWSCYRGGGVPCGRCDSCYYRAKGFKEAGLKDPTVR